MKVLFIFPPPGEFPSGGHVFNRHLLAEAARNGFPLEAVFLAPGEPAAGAFPLEPGGVILWDSLFLEWLAEHPPPETGAVHGLLVHYLPFLNPRLDAESRKGWEQRFDRTALGMRFLLATGRGAANRLERRYPAMPIFLCEPGVDPAFAAARWVGPEPASGKIRIATVANLLPAKGQLELLKILASLEGPAWEWHLVGDERSDPAYAERFRNRAARFGLAERIVCHGALNRSDLAGFLARMDLFAFPSRYEAYGMVLAEAVAAGLPVVTTAVGEAERLVSHGATGFVVPVNDCGRFRAALARLMIDEALRRRFRENLRREPPRSWGEAFGEFEAAMRTVDQFPR